MCKISHNQTAADLGRSVGGACQRIRIGLVGDFDPTVPAHQAIPIALSSASKKVAADVACEWVPTDEITSIARLTAFSGLWCVPASPYRNMDGALMAIRHARESGLPFLGTCGGFQHALIEYARNVLGWADAEHGETAPTARRRVVVPLRCEMVEAIGDIRIVPGTKLASIYRELQVQEKYRCRYGLNAEFQQALLDGQLRAAAFDDDREVRAVELDGHHFFVATLFQPERGALNGNSVPLVEAFVRASCNCAAVNHIVS